MLFRTKRHFQSGTASEVRHNEEIVFYPSYVAPDATGDQWTITFQGCLYNLHLTWLRHPIVGAIRRAMRIGSEYSEVFSSRLKPFLVGVEEGRQVFVRIGSDTIPLGKSSSAGLFSGTHTLSRKDLETLLGHPLRPGAWVPYQAVLDEADTRQFDGVSMIVDRAGLSIISDVDDTVKHSNVSDRRDLFHNTFARVFAPIDGMPAIYRDLAQLGAVFHYVSGSPWQLYRPLRDFWDTHHFPVGSFHLKKFRLRDSARKLKMSPQMMHKRTSIDPILAAFPDRRFILVGDTGEQDPEIYASVLRDYPQQILGVYLRVLNGETPDLPRFQTAYADLPPDLWHLYQNPDVLRPHVIDQARRYFESHPHVTHVDSNQIVIPESA